MLTVSLTGSDPEPGGRPPGSDPGGVGAAHGPVGL